MKKYKKFFTYLFLHLMLPFLASCSGSATDHSQMLREMGNKAVEKIQSLPGSALRKQSVDFFENYIIDLGWRSFVFGGAPDLHVLLYPYETEHLATAAISQFEAPSGSSALWDCAGVIRPNANIRAPLFTWDVFAPMAGMAPGMDMDFYNINEGSVDIAVFFGDQAAKLNQALALVEPYQLTGEERGKYSEHFDQYKSDYRWELELSEIEFNNETIRGEFVSAVATAFSLVLDAYFTSLERVSVEDNETLIQGNISGTEEFIEILVDKDPALEVGRILFEDDLEMYFLDSMWRQGYYGEGF